MVLHAVNSYNNNTLCIVLAAGIDLNSKISKDLFYNNPLTAANFSDLIKIINLFIKFGAKIGLYNLEN